MVNLKTIIRQLVWRDNIHTVPVLLVVVISAGDRGEGGTNSFRGLDVVVDVLLVHSVLLGEKRIHRKTSLILSNVNI